MDGAGIEAGESRPQGAGCPVDASPARRATEKNGALPEVTRRTLARCDDLPRTAIPLVACAGSPGRRGSTPSTTTAADLRGLCKSRKHDGHDVTTGTTDYDGKT